jgi:energy-coupling factor transport system ATP-binding protein
MEAIIEANQLYDLYNSENKPVEEAHVAINGLDLTIEAGSFVAVLGRNGSGKSTLAKHFNAILLPSGGKVYVDGLDTSDEKLTLAIRSNVGMVFQR